MSRPRILIAKPGLDGHDRGAMVVAMALRDAGAEVVYLGLRNSIQRIFQAVVDEDVDVVGLSVLSGAHLDYTDELLALLRAHGLEQVPVAVGGTISQEDARTLERQGVHVFPVGTPLTEVVQGVLHLATHGERGGDAA